MAKRAFSRRQLFRMGPRALAELKQESEGHEEPDPLRPPGACKDDAQFLSSCERCHACADACPYAAINIFKGPDHGQHESTPYMNPAESPCRWCKTMDCIQACPSDALQFNVDKPAAVEPQDLYRYVDPIAKVSIDHNKCMLSQGTLCDECNLFCPSHTKSILVLGRSVRLNEESCTGCGLCVAHCPATPNAITLVDGQQE